MGVTVADGTDAGGTDAGGGTDADGIDADGNDAVGQVRALARAGPELHGADEPGSRPGMRLLMNHLQPLDRDMRVELSGR